MTNVWIGSIPPHIISKAQSAMNSSPVKGTGWKKINGLRNCLSYRLNPKYRVLCLKGTEFIICNHSTYEKKIKTLRKKAANSATCI